MKTTIDKGRRVSSRRTVNSSGHIRVLATTALLLGLGSGASQAQFDSLPQFDVPDPVCRGEVATITHLTPTNHSSIDSFDVLEFGSSEPLLVEHLIYQADEEFGPSILWNVSAAMPEATYIISIVVSYGGDARRLERPVNVVSCTSDYPYQGDQMEQELYELERQLWEEQVMSSPWPPEPGCLECSTYEVEVAEVLSVFDYSGFEQTLVVHMLDGRGRLFAEVGRFAPVRGRYAGNPGTALVETGTALAFRRHCGMQIAVTDVSGYLIAKAPICLDVVRGRGRR